MTHERSADACNDTFILATNKIVNYSFETCMMPPPLLYSR